MRRSHISSRMRYMRFLSRGTCFKWRHFDACREKKMFWFLNCECLSGFPIVCRKWKSIINNCWRSCSRLHIELIHDFDQNYFYHELEPMNFNDFRELLGECGPFVKQITIPNISCQDGHDCILSLGVYSYRLKNFKFLELLPTLKDHFTNMKEFTMSCYRNDEYSDSCDFMLKPSFEKFLNWVKNNQLTHMNIDCCNSMLSLVTTEKFPSSLISLRLFDLRLSSLSNMNLNLQELMIENDFIIDKNEVPSCLQHLKVLHVEIVTVEKEINGSKVLSQLVHLEDLKVPFEVMFRTKKDFLLLSKCLRQIKKLNLPGDDESTCIISSYKKIELEWPELQELVMAPCFCIKNCCYLPIFKNLQKLVLDQFLIESKAATFNAFAQMSNLMHLKILIRANWKPIDKIVNFLISMALARKHNFELLMIPEFDLFEVSNTYNKITICVGSQTTFHMTCSISKFSMITYDFAERNLSHVVKNYPQFPIKFKKSFGIKNYWDDYTFIP